MFVKSDFLYKNNLTFNNEHLPYLGNGSLTGVDLDHFNIDNLFIKRQLVRNELNLNKDDFVLLFLGRKSVVKGIHKI